MYIYTFDFLCTCRVTFIFRLVYVYLVCLHVDVYTDICTGISHSLYLRFHSYLVFNRYVYMCIYTGCSNSAICACTGVCIYENIIPGLVLVCICIYAFISRFVFRGTFVFYIYMHGLNYLRVRVCIYVYTYAYAQLASLFLYISTSLQHARVHTSTYVHMCM